MEKGIILPCSLFLRSFEITSFYQRKTFDREIERNSIKQEKYDVS